MVNVYLTQVVVDKPFMRKEIAKELLVQSKELINSKFDYLIGYMKKILNLKKHILNLAGK